MPILDSISRFLDSSATLGMTWEGRNDIDEGLRFHYRHSRVRGNPENPAGSMLFFGGTVLDSRLRGNDGCGAGMTVEREKIARKMLLPAIDLSRQA